MEPFTKEETRELIDAMVEGASADDAVDALVAAMERAKTGNVDEISPAAAIAVGAGAGLVARRFGARGKARKAAIGAYKQKYHSSMAGQHSNKARTAGRAAERGGILKPAHGLRAKYHKKQAGKHIKSAYGKK